MAEAARAVLTRPTRTGLYLWVLEQNVGAQAFYEARGGRCVGRRQVTPPVGPRQAPGGPRWTCATPGRTRKRSFSSVTAALLGD